MQLPRFFRAGGIFDSMLKKPDTSAIADTQTLTGTTNPATTVDPGVNQVNQLGRAALISTSPQGVQGTDNVGRYRLLGN